MESELSPDKSKDVPTVPLKTYRWEDIRRCREAGGYPWTHLLKPPLEGEITAEDIIRETTPRKSMSRETSRSRTRSPVGGDLQILNLDSSPGSSRKHGEDGEDEGVHIPNFSKEVSLDSEPDDMINQTTKSFVVRMSENQSNTLLPTAQEIRKDVSPKSILKRRMPEPQYIGVSEIREKTKCCHPLVNKIKHLADKTLHKSEKMENDKSPLPKRSKNNNSQEIRQLRKSPGAARRQKFSAIKLGDSDEMSTTINSLESAHPQMKKEHIYEDIQESKMLDVNKDTQLSQESTFKGVGTESNRYEHNKETESLFEKKSNASQDPSLVIEENTSLKSVEHVMEKLHKKTETNKEAVILDDDPDSEEPNIDEVFQNQLEDTRKGSRSPKVTITEIIDDGNIDSCTDPNSPIPIESSPTPSPCAEEKRVEFLDMEWSKPSSDHEYEVIEKPPPNIVYTVPSKDETANSVRTDDELSSTTSLERKYLQHISDEDEQMENKENFNNEINDKFLEAEALQNDIENRFFVNTPSSISRTECEISTSQVDSSALENLPLKRDSRIRNIDSFDNRIQKRIKEGTNIIKSQAGKLKNKLRNIKTKQFTERPRIIEKSKLKNPEKPKFSLPDKKKFSLPERSKFKNMNITEKLSLGDRKIFTLPDRPKFPDLPKFKIPDKPKLNFSSLGRKKEVKIDHEISESNPDLEKRSKEEFEAKTFPRLFSRKKKNTIAKTASSPMLNREETPPPTFTFTRANKTNTQRTGYIPDSPEHPREYGSIKKVTGENENRKYDIPYNLDKVSSEYIDEDNVSSDLSDSRNVISTPEISPSKQEYQHVINEINNDEFFVRPRGISHENIQVREYLSDEIRQAFNMPINSLEIMGSDKHLNVEKKFENGTESDPDFIENNELIRYSDEDVNERDDGYYTFPPVRPSRAKRKKHTPETKQEAKTEIECIKYIDNSVNDSDFNEINLDLSENIQDELNSNTNISSNNQEEEKLTFVPIADLQSYHEYANDDVIQYSDTIPLESKTLPFPPKRKKKHNTKDVHCSLKDINNVSSSNIWEQRNHHRDDIIVYRTEHEYLVPEIDDAVTDQILVPPRRTRSRSSPGTSICDDDRTSHGAESLTLDTHVLPSEEIERSTRQESPGYATVNKSSNYTPSKTVRRSMSKTPPVKRRKSNSSERKYYTIGSPKTSIPSRPPRKKSSVSDMALDNLSKCSLSADLTQYVEIDEPEIEEVHKKLDSGEVLSKMKDRPLPPPPRPPRLPKHKKCEPKHNDQQNYNNVLQESCQDSCEEHYCDELNDVKKETIEEIEVSTQTDPLPDDVDFELSLNEHLDISMNSLRDLVEEEPLSKSLSKLTELSRASRTKTLSEKSLKLSDPKISELSKSSIGRTSPTVILVERRVSSPTRINEREEMLTEASLTVQPIDIDEAQAPDVPPLPKARTRSASAAINSRAATVCKDESAIERISDASRDIKLDNLVTEHLQVRDLDVGRLSVSELQASKILVSDIEGMTLQVTELDSKSGHISVSGIEFSPTVIDEIVKKFAEISTSNVPLQSSPENIRLETREEQTQTDILQKDTIETMKIAEQDKKEKSPPPDPKLPNLEDILPPQRPPPPDLTPLLYSYFQDLNQPSNSLYHPRHARDRPFTEFYESQHQTPAPPIRRAKRKQTAHVTDSSSDESHPQPSPRRTQPPAKAHEPTITEAGVQFLKVCQNSITKTLRHIFNSFMSYISGTEDKKDIQMALVIFLVLIAGLIMFGISDSRTIHHHHWEFFNPPDSKQ